MISKCKSYNTTKRLLFTQVAHGVGFTQQTYAKSAIHANNVVSLTTVLSLLSIQYDVTIKQIITNVSLRQCVVIPACIRVMASIGCLLVVMDLHYLLNTLSAADTIRYAYVKCAVPMQIKPLFKVRL